MKKKITFDLKPSWHGSATETVWAEPTADGNYILLNSPFLAFGVNYQDTVSVKAGASGELVFDALVKSSGHSTYRLMLLQDETSWRPFWLKLQNIGCSYEEGYIGSNHLLAIDVPADSNIYDAYRHMEQGEAAGVWEFEEAAVGHVLRS